MRERHIRARTRSTGRQLRMKLLSQALDAASVMPQAVRWRHSGAEYALQRLAAVRGAS